MERLFPEEVINVLERYTDRTMSPVVVQAHKQAIEIIRNMSALEDFVSDNPDISLKCWSDDGELSITDFINGTYENK